MSGERGTLYYDGQCKLCNAEMGRLKAQRSKQISLKDIHQLQVDEETKHRMLRVLHLVSADGSVKKGLEANIEAWQGTRWGGVWRTLRWPVIGRIAGLVYDKWASQRYARLYQGNVGEEDLKS